MQNESKNKITELDNSAVSTYKNERLEYFLCIDNQKIHELFLPIEELLEEKSLANTKRELKQKLAKSLSRVDCCFQYVWTQS